MKSIEELKIRRAKLSSNGNDNKNIIRKIDRQINKA